MLWTVMYNAPMTKEWLVCLNATDRPVPAPVLSRFQIFRTRHEARRFCKDMRNLFGSSGYSYRVAKARVDECVTASWEKSGNSVTSSVTDATDFVRKSLTSSSQ